MNTLKKLSLILFSWLACVSVGYAHYPILNCTVGGNANQPNEVVCEASFSNRAKAPNVLMEVYSADDEVIATGHTDDDAFYSFERPDGVYFIIMDAGPGHVVEISDEEVSEI